MNTIILLHHTPDEWAERLALRLLGLGCSTDYVKSVAEGIHALDQPVPHQLGVRWQKETA